MARFLQLWWDRYNKKAAKWLPVTLTTRLKPGWLGYQVFDVELKLNGFDPNVFRLCLVDVILNHFLHIKCNGLGVREIQHNF